MNKWNYDEDRIAYADGTGTYDAGFYFADVAANECGAEPVGGPFKTRDAAISARDKWDDDLRRSEDSEPSYWTCPECGLSNVFDAMNPECTDCGCTNPDCV